MWDMGVELKELELESAFMNKGVSPQLCAMRRCFKSNAVPRGMDGSLQRCTSKSIISLVG